MDATDEDLERVRASRMLRRAVAVRAAFPRAHGHPDSRDRLRGASLEVLLALFTLGDVTSGALAEAVARAEPGVRQCLTELEGRRLAVEMEVPVSPGGGPLPRSALWVISPAGRRHVVELLAGADPLLVD